MRRPGVGAARRGGFRGIGGSSLLAPAITISGTRGGTLTATVTGSPTPTVQWQAGATLGGGGSWANIAGATSLTFDDSGASPVTAAYDVRCVATNAAGSTNSNTLTAWTPASLPNLWGRYEAFAANLTLSGSEVTQWNDQSANGNHLAAASADSAVYPLYEATGLGGPCVLFDGTGEWLRDSAASIGAALSTYTVAVLQDAVTVTSGDFIMAYGTGIAITQRAAAVRHAGPGGVAQDSTSAATTAGLYTATWDGANENLRFNNTLEVGPTANANAAPADGQVLAMGASRVGASFGNSRIAGMWLMSSVISAGNLALLRLYCTAAGWP